MVSLPETVPEGPPDCPPASAAEIGAALVRLLRLVERARAEPAGELDRPLYMLLFEVVNSGPARVSALAEAVHSDPSTISRQVAHLVDLGLLQRRPDPDDRRATLLAVTGEGEALLQRARALRDRRVAEIVEGWSTDDRERFAALLNRFTTDFVQWRCAR